MAECLTRIRQIRNLKRMSQSELAILSGVSQSAISSYEVGEREPTASALYEISKVLGCTMEALYSPDEYEEKNIEHESQDMNCKIRELEELIMKKDEALRVLYYRCLVFTKGKHCYHCKLKEICTVAGEDIMKAESKSDDGGGDEERQGYAGDFDGGNDHDGGHGVGGFVRENDVIRDG